jgi:hypothetical protein
MKQFKWMPMALLVSFGLVGCAFGLLEKDQGVPSANPVSLTDSFQEPVISQSIKLSTPSYSGTDNSAPVRVVQMKSTLRSPARFRGSHLVHKQLHDKAVILVLLCAGSRAIPPSPILSD